MLSVVADVGGTAAVLEKAADVEAHGVVDPAAVAEIDLLLIETQARGEADLATFVLTSIADVVDHRAWGLRGEGRGAAAANGLHALDVGVVTGPVVVVAKLNVAEQNCGQAVFLQLHKFRTTGDHGNAANTDIGVTAGAGCILHLQARDQAEHFGFRPGGEILNGLLRNAVHRHRGFQFRLFAARGGDHDHIQVNRTHTGGGRGCRISSPNRRGHCQSRAQGDQRNHGVLADCPAFRGLHLFLRDAVEL